MPKGHPQKVRQASPGVSRLVGTIRWVTANLPTTPTREAFVLRTNSPGSGSDLSRAVCHATSAPRWAAPAVSAAPRSRNHASASREAMSASSSWIFYGEGPAVRTPPFGGVGSAHSRAALDPVGGGIGGGAGQHFCSSLRNGAGLGERLSRMYPKTAALPTWLKAQSGRSQNPLCPGPGRPPKCGKRGRRIGSARPGREFVDLDPVCPLRSSPPTRAWRRSRRTA